MKTLKDIQIQLETQSIANAIGKFNSSLEHKVNKGEEGSTQYGIQAIQLIQPIAYEYLQNAVAAKGKSVGFKALFKQAQAEWKEEVAQLKQEGFSSQHLPKEPILINSYAVAHCIASNLSAEMRAIEMVNLLVKIASRQLYLTPEEVVEINQPGLSFYLGMLTKVAYESDIFEMQQENGRDYYLNVSVEWVDIIESFGSRGQSDAKEYVPMVCKPIPHTNLYSREGGYLKTPSPLLKRPGKVLGTKDRHPLIENFTEETNPAFFNYINKVQGTPFSVNTKLLNVIKELQENGLHFSMYHTDIDCHTVLIEEEVNKEVNDRNEKRRKYSEYKGTEYEPLLESTVAGIKRRVKSKYNGFVRSANYILEQANFYKEFEAIYYPVFADSRGRVYPYSVYGLTVQGCEMSKALLQFANKEKLTEEGITQLYATLANTLGFDKMNFNLKVKEAKIWFAKWSKKERFEVFVEKESEFDEPINALAICLELMSYYKNPRGYKCGYIAHRDARCSGSSINGTLLRDVRAMTLTSVIEEGIDTTKLPDAYKDCAESAVELLQGLENSEYKDELNTHLDFLFSRANFKYPVMLNNYGGTLYGLKMKQKECISEEGLEISKEASYLYTDITAQALAVSLPSCAKLLEVTKKIAREVAKRDGEIVYSHPITNFPTVLQAFQVKKTNVDVLTEYKRITLKINKKTDKIDVNALVGAFSPNVTHGYDNSLLYSVANNVEHDLALIHDSLGSHPNNCRATVQAYANAVHSLAVGNSLDSLFAQLKVEDKVPYFNTATESELASIPNSVHILT